MTMQQASTSSAMQYVCMLLREGWRQRLRIYGHGLNAINEAIRSTFAGVLVRFPGCQLSCAVSSN